MTSILARQGGITVDDVELAQWAADNSTDAENEDIVREFEVCLVAAKSESIYAASVDEDLKDVKTSAKPAKKTIHSPEGNVPKPLRANL
ncbi:MAG: hypothetical protein LQ343_003450 [Gyalolechia ehrenbergii]|nr:MAG: hypothetical protein LQ343_003450 [Gyalolechia ehrenbergii]